MLNSKILSYISADVADPDPIAPIIFLMGLQDSSLPQAMFANNNLICRCSWCHSQILADHFCPSFIRDYLLGLQQCGKWQGEVENMNVGQVVMVVDPQSPCALWPVGT